MIEADRLIAPKAGREDELFDRAIRPRALADYTGQPHVVEQMTIFIEAARRRGEAYLLERRLFRRKTTGEVIDPTWLQFSFPHWYHYDVLRALDYLRAVGATHDERVAEAVRAFAGEVVLTGEHPNGSSRLSEAADRRVQEQTRASVSSNAAGRDELHDLYS